MRIRPHGISVYWPVIAFAIAAVTLFFLSGTASAKTITVAKDGGGDYTTIQDAINASENGDTVYVKEGTYQEHVTVNKTINLMGEGADRVTINGGRGRDVVRIIADWVNMSGFNVTGSDWGAGIEVESNHNHIFENSCSNKSSGIRLWYSNNSTISNNTCPNNEGGIGLQFSNNNTIMNNTCNSNNGDGIEFVVNSNNNAITNNICSNNYNGIYLYHSSSNTILHTNCSSNNNDGIYLEDSSKDNTAHYNIISGNRDYGINVSYNKDYTIDARYNYWGDPSGPYHPSKNPNGKGNNITDYVVFDPWLRKASDMEPGTGGSSENFLMKYYGPLPLLGYLAIAAGVILVGFAAVKKKDGKKQNG